MMDAEFFLHGVVLLSGILGAVGAGYLLYTDTVVVHYAGFFKLVTTGLLLFAASAPIIVRFAPDLIHGVHALSALFISVGLYGLVRQEFGTEDFEQFRERVREDGY
jgi:hypothetical protein